MPPQRGSLAFQIPSSSTQTVHVSPSTCHNLSLFKDILREYRRLDDTILMRLNRANAAMRDQERNRHDSEYGNIQDQACAHLWRELIGNWKRRSQLIDYCSNVVDQSLGERRDKIASAPADQPKEKVALIEDEVKRNQIQNEFSIETIVRKRTAEAFRSRCQYFVPEFADEEILRMWNQTQH